MHKKPKSSCMDFLLRPWRMEDVESLVLAANNSKIANFMTDMFPHPYTEDKGREFIEYASRGNPPNILAIEMDNKAVGGIGIHPQADIYRMNAELGYWLAEPYWGKGVMTKAVRQMVEYAFKNWNMNRIYARPFGTNKASQKVLEKAGFTLEGRFEKTLFKNGEYFDELVYAIRRK